MSRGTDVNSALGPGGTVPGYLMQPELTANQKAVRQLLIAHGGICLVSGGLALSDRAAVQERFLIMARESMLKKDEHPRMCCKSVAP